MSRVILEYEYTSSVYLVTVYILNTETRAQMKLKRSFLILWCFIALKQNGLGNVLSHATLMLLVHACLPFENVIKVTFACLLNDRHDRHTYESRRGKASIFTSRATSFSMFRIKKCCSVMK